MTDFTCGVFSACASKYVSRVARQRRTRILVAMSVLVVLCVLVLAGPVAASAASTISGVLRDQATGTPITGADVGMTLERLDGRAWAVETNQVAVAGAYSFTGLGAGSYRIRQTGSSPYGYFPPQNDPGPAMEVDGATDTTADWPLTRTGFGGGTSEVSGRVIDDASGMPVVGPMVWVSLDQMSPNGSWAHIGDSFQTGGSYVFGELGAGRYRVRFQGSPPTGYEFRGYQTSPILALDGTTDGTYDWRLWSTSTQVPASSAWSLGLAAFAAIGLVAARALRARTASE